MHPIIKEFIETGEGIASILERHHDKNQFLEKVFNTLCQEFSGYDIEPQVYLDLDQAIIKGHPDSRVYLLFISFAIMFTSNRHENERAKVLESIGMSILLKKVHPLEQSYFYQAIAFFRLMEGKTAECKEFINKSLKLIDRTTPRYFRILLNIANLLSEQGELKYLGKDDLDLLDSPPNDEVLSFIGLELQLKNSIVTSNWKKGRDLLEKYKLKNLLIQNIFIKIYNNLLKLHSGDFDEKNYDEDFFKYFASTCHFLSLGQLDKAIKYSNLLQKAIPEKKIIIQFTKYFPLHIELSQRNKGMARLLYRELEQKESPHYLDDLFLARLQLLEANKVEAHETFHRLMENIKRYGAMNRLIFELQFAKEMNPSDILLLTNGYSYDDYEINAKDNGNRKISSTAKVGNDLLIGKSQIILQLKELIKRFAKLKDPILITGETGTGKELVSRAIHEEGPYHNEPFLAINCGALTESLLQSELFGYVAGAFTGAQKERKGIFEAAGQGTVFLDEFGDISPQMQVSLLRVLESNEIRLIGGTSSRIIKCKIVIATNIDLQKAVESKKFREDLFFRLTRFDINLRPLRERKEDIPELINYFLNSSNSHKKDQKLSKSLMVKLLAYHWPGNIRELKNEMERLSILHGDKEVLDLEDFDLSRLQKIEKNLVTNEIIDTPKHNSLHTLESQEPIIDKRIISIIERGSKADQRVKFLMNLFKQFKKLTRMQVIEIMKVSPATATKDLDILCKSGAIEKIMPTKSVKSYYFLLVE